MCRGDPDCVGVVNSQHEKNLINSAIADLMKKTYAKLTPWYDFDKLEDVFRNASPSLDTATKQLYTEAALLKKK